MQIAIFSGPGLGFIGSALLLVPLLWRRGWPHLLWTVPAAGLALLFLEGDGAAHTRPFPNPEAELACRMEAACWGERHLATAARACFPRVEADAIREHRWSETAHAARLPRVAILDADRGIISYEGDAVEMRDGFGRWIRHAYSCILDPRSGEVRVRLRKVPL